LQQPGWKREFSPGRKTEVKVPKKTIETKESVAKKDFTLGEDSSFELRGNRELCQKGPVRKLKVLIERGMLKTKKTANHHGFTIWDLGCRKKEQDGGGEEIKKEAGENMTPNKRGKGEFLKKWWSSLRKKRVN